MNEGVARTSLRIDFPNGFRLGPGKADLLELVERHGSISAAGAAMDMSYRRAWMLVDEINRMFREPSVVTRHGGKAGGGAELTPFGQELLARYRRMEQATRSTIESDLDCLASALAASERSG
ncbi:winged helix-turn-helix domain-containing protein [Rhizobiaceae bacterium BDR2-2]|uniref:Winged helix-turn-helix domain-containing protein n=1 Tax=Ectorhizobium quercum TaxID=2965071 RepID=A0AAE3MWS8_9HYPH|nr:winged helix-turn-helix domain-containing protein [Ectorhizobium quercum]MCX8996349.1 winged helix-turn-helix domain-containing protein [Ectorhizobium quercum]MCX8998612.1 winged helix-turn-helix domain-containing protein [Ectorhizobium quercum]